MNTLTKQYTPVDKLYVCGTASLTNEELLSIILNQGKKDDFEITTARQLLSECDYDLNQLFSQDQYELKDASNLSLDKSALLASVFELLKRKLNFESQSKKLVNSSHAAYELLFPEFLYLKHEEFKIALLNRSNKLIKIITTSKGGISGTIVDPKILFKYVFRYSATGMVISHNHPSGHLKPSKEDIRITKKLIEAANSLDIKIHDHLIINDQQYFSFKDEGLL